MITHKQKSVLIINLIWQSNICLVLLHSYVYTPLHSVASCLKAILPMSTCMHTVSHSCMHAMINNFDAHYLLSCLLCFAHGHIYTYLKEWVKNKDRVNAWCEHVIILSYIVEIRWCVNTNPIISKSFGDGKAFVLAQNTTIKSKRVSHTTYTHNTYITINTFTTAFQPECNRSLQANHSWIQPHSNSISD